MTQSRAELTSQGTDPTATIDVLSFWEDVLAPWVPVLQQDTWGAWKVALKAMFALPMEGVELPLYRGCTGHKDPLYSVGQPEL